MALGRSTMRKQVIENLSQVAPPGEQFIACIHAETGPSPWLNILFEEIPFAMLIVQILRKYYFLTLTNGHLDVLFRARRLADRVIVAILENDEKEPLFSIEERLEMIREIVGEDSTVSVRSFSGLLVDFAAQTGATLLVRGLRAISDYEYELQMALMNRKLEPRLETVFMLPGESFSYLSSKLVREIAQLGGPLKDLVPPEVEQRLRAKVL